MVPIKPVNLPQTAHYTTILETFSRQNFSANRICQPPDDFLSIT
uniref:Uncharacterized protein n=1 Tax=Anguilla anguilla TaxID=7936 RepID=A0A0E9RFD2_ANGAN